MVYDWSGKLVPLEVFLDKSHWLLVYNTIFLIGCRVNVSSTCEQVSIRRPWEDRRRVGVRFARSLADSMLGSVAPSLKLSQAKKCTY